MSEQTPPQASNPQPPQAPPAHAYKGGSKKLRVGEILLEQGEITKEQLNKALDEQRAAGRRIGEVLLEHGYISNTVLVRALAKAQNVRGVTLRHGLIDPALLKAVGEEECMRLKAIPLFKIRGVLTVATVDPNSLPTIDRLRQLTSCKIRAVYALEANIVEYIKKYSGGNVDVNEFLTSLQESDVEVVEREQVDEGPSTDLDKMIEGSPIVNLVNIAFLTAVRDRASDIHIEPDKKGTRVRYRIDGNLRDLMKPPPGIHGAIVSRVKVIGRMDIAEKRLPQEGRVRIVAEGREVDLRVSSIPTLLGEKIVVRILDKANLRIKPEELGMRGPGMEGFKRMLDMSHGLVLVTGPTGSGKTTTLYSALEFLRSPEVNIVTVEDPVEYQLDLINQIQVSEQIGMTFARALRSILRQDPDVIMVGEIRDNETARVAVQAALTGHLVLATLHTNDAPGAIARLVDMACEPYLLSGAINGAVAQRLARTVCPHCASKYYPAEQVLRDAGIDPMQKHVFRKGAGCRQCHDTGFQGRIGIYEVMEVTPELRRMVHHGRPTHELREVMRKGGALTLREEGVIAALAGKTSLEEVLRVTQNDDDDHIKEAPAASSNAAVQAQPAKEAA